MTTGVTLSPPAEQLRSLRIADSLFYERGITGVTMAQIRDESGLSMRRLYSMYSTKAHLITAWLRYRHHTWLGGFRARVAGHIDGGMAPVDAMFEGLEEWMAETNFRGCGFVNTHAAGQGLTEEHSEIIRSHKAVDPQDPPRRPQPRLQDPGPAVTYVLTRVRGQRGPHLRQRLTAARLAANIDPLDLGGDVQALVALGDRVGAASTGPASWPRSPLDVMTPGSNPFTHSRQRNPR